MQTNRILFIPFLSLLTVFSPLSAQSAKNVAQTESPQLFEAPLTLLSTLLAESKQELFDGLDYLSSKEIDIYTKVFGRVTVHYKARWGYRGPGDEQKPFKGFKGQFIMPIKLARGLTIDPLQADRAKELVEEYDLNRFIDVSPLDECRLKIVQLTLALCRDEIEPTRFWNDLGILLKRLYITPGMDGLYLGEWRIVGTAQHPGYLETLLQLPEEKVAGTKRWLISLIKTAAPLFGLTTKSGDPYALMQFLQSIDYSSDQECVLSHEGTRLAVLQFGYHGSGNLATPLQGCLLRINVPIADAANDIFESVEHKRLGLPQDFELVLPVSPLYEALLKMCMLAASTLNGSFDQHTVPAELENLIHRVLITPGIGEIGFKFGGKRIKLIGTEQDPGLLRILSAYSHEIMTYSFSPYDGTPLNPAEAIKYMLALAYKTFMDYTTTRIQVQKQLELTDTGREVLTALKVALAKLKAVRTQKNAASFKYAYQTYRHLEIATGKSRFQAIVNDVIDNCARFIRRTIHINNCSSLLDVIPVIRELRAGGINIDLSRFWRTLGEKQCAQEESTVEKSVLVEKSAA